MKGLQHGTAQIIPLVFRETQPLKATEPRGQILLFTGVRYERLDQDPFDPSESGLSTKAKVSKVSRARRR